MSNFVEAVRKWLHTYITLKFILFVRLIFGFYFKVHSSAILSLLLKSYCVIVICSATFIIFNNFTFIGADVVVCFLISAMISLITEERNFLKYCEAVIAMDRTMGWERVRIESDNLYIILIVIIMNRIFHIYIYSDIHVDAVSYYAMAFIFASIDINQITITIVFDVLYQRFEMLRLSLEELFSRNGADSDALLYNVRKYTLVYKELLDAVQYQDSEFQLKMIMAVIRCVLNCISTVVISFGEKGDIQLTQIQLISLIYAIASYGFIACIPAFFAEMTVNKADNILSLLTTFQFKCQDATVRATVRRAARYVSVRRARVRLLRAVRFDSSLPLTIGGLCFTATFITLQMFHYV